MIQQNFKLLVGVKSEPLFETEQEYQDFRASFQQEVKPELDRQREARQQSEEDAKRHLVS
jgi:hypothetical protein